MRVHIGARGGVLLRCGRDRLRDLFHLHDGFRDLPDPLRLLTARGADLVGQLADLSHVHGDIAEVGAKLRDGLPAVAGLRHGFLDQRRGVFRGVGRPLREVAYFFRHRGEPEAGLAGPGSFDGGVERENVRLKRDFVDRLQNPGNLVA